MKKTMLIAALMLGASANAMNLQESNLEKLCEHENVSKVDIFELVPSVDHHFFFINAFVKCDDTREVVFRYETHVFDNTKIERNCPGIRESSYDEHYGCRDKYTTIKTVDISKKHMKLSHDNKLTFTLKNAPMNFRISDELDDVLFNAKEVTFEADLNEYIFDGDYYTENTKVKVTYNPSDLPFSTYEGKDKTDEYLSVDSISIFPFTKNFAYDAEEDDYTVKNPDYSPRDVINFLRRELRKKK